jgi:hypothetical protein
LRTKDGGYSLHSDDFRVVVDAELEALLQQSSWLVLSLVTELGNRPMARLKGIRECCEKLQESAGNIRILEWLDDRDAKFARLEIAAPSAQWWYFTQFQWFV